MSDMILGYPNGMCATHGPKISINGVSQCLKCMSLEAKANARPAGVVTVEDPGDEAMARINKLPPREQSDQVPVAKPVVAAPKLSAGASVPFDAYIDQAIEYLRKAPMPGDLKQFKAVQKAIQQLEKARGAVSL